MKDKEMIEEMAKDLCIYCHDMTEEQECPYIEHEESKQECWKSQLEQAKTLYNAGYRKLPKDSVVLSREEYVQLVTRPNLHIATDVFAVRKETAEKILNELYCTPKEQVENKIKELARFIGVEIKE